MTVWKVPKAVGDVKNSGPGLCVELSKPELFSPSPFGQKVKRWTLERDDDGRDWEPFLGQHTDPRCRFGRYRHRVIIHR
jgi:hypothetical protein